MKAGDFATDATNMSVIMSDADGVISYKRWYVKSPPMELLHSSATIFYISKTP